MVLQFGFAKALSEKYSSLKNEFESLTARKLSVLMMKVSAFPLNLVGIRVLVDCRVTAYSFMAASFIVLHNILCFYTAYYYWNDNKVSSVQPFAVAAISIPVISDGRLSTIAQVLLSLRTVLVGLYLLQSGRTGSLPSAKSVQVHHRLRHEEREANEPLREGAAPLCQGNTDGDAEDHNHHIAIVCGCFDRANSRTNLQKRIPHPHRSDSPVHEPGHRQRFLDQFGHSVIHRIHRDAGTDWIGMYSHIGEFHVEFDGEIVGARDERPVGSSLQRRIQTEARALADGHLRSTPRYRRLCRRIPVFLVLEVLLPTVDDHCLRFSGNRRTASGKSLTFSTQICSDFKHTCIRTDGLPDKASPFAFGCNA